MDDSTELYKICDKVLDKLSVSISLYIEELPITNENIRRSAILQLLDDKYIERSPDIQSIVITPKGQIFIKNGGYSNQIEVEKRRNDYTDQLQQSTIQTNKSVQDMNIATLTNFTIQRNLTIASILVSCVAVIFAAIALFKDTDAEMRAQNKILEKQRQIIESIKQSLKAKQSFQDSPKKK